MAVAGQVIGRGQVYLVRLDPTLGSEIKKTRPCVVVSPDELNEHLRTVIVAPMTTGGRAYPWRPRCRFQRPRRGSLHSISFGLSMWSVSCKCSDNLKARRLLRSWNAYRRCSPISVEDRLQSNFSPRTPKHQGKPGSTRDQRARRINKIENLAKSAKPPSPVQIRAAPPISPSKSDRLVAEASTADRQT